jgi:hypothetical protein
VNYIANTKIHMLPGRRHELPPDYMRAAERRFRLFHCFAPARVVRAPCRRLIPKVLVHLGSLRGLIYSSDKQTPKQQRTYIHFMKTPARLACNPAGTQLYIIGGRYRVTPRGIEG